MGRLDAARGDALRARHPRAPGQGPLRRRLELLRLAPDEGAGRSPTPAACRVRSPSRSTTPSRRARRSTSWCRSPSPKASASSSGARSPAGCSRGKYGPDGPSARQAAGWREPPIRDVPRLWRIVEVLKEVGAAHGVSAAQVALAWLLGRPGVASLVIGGRNREQFEDSLARRRPRARARGARPARHGQRPAGALSLLAPELDRRRPPRPRRFPRRALIPWQGSSPATYAAKQRP